ncbi:hypothetical protein GA0074695_4389 [Micromonospora viridifaciens]|uniref:Uncharacterized protein n=1 Tax=Micromonospora viridifaciens TaxID=1881 RepID=A0A1C4YKK6_MICVI|nr:hypothetical protein [Micromonospora viridifaciens]SCF21273.1 hypothetical protein GA0074695_4389 [Micromonospora viridifaciens]
MNPANVRSNIRSLLGLGAVSLAVAGVIVAGQPSSAPEPERPWQPPAGYVLADTVPLEHDHTLRLWTSPTGWYVESLRLGQHKAAVGAGGSSSEYTVSEVLDGLVGAVPVAGAQAVSVGTPGATVRAGVHGGWFLVPASVVLATDDTVPVTPLDASGNPLAEETAVPIDGRG